MWDSSKFYLSCWLVSAFCNPFIQRNLCKVYNPSLHRKPWQSKLWIIVWFIYILKTLIWKEDITILSHSNTQREFNMSACLQSWLYFKTLNFYPGDCFKEQVDDIIPKYKTMSKYFMKNLKVRIFFLLSDCKSPI